MTLGVQFISCVGFHNKPHFYDALRHIYEYTTIYVCCAQCVNWTLWLSLQIRLRNRTQCGKTTIDESYNIQYSSQQFEFQFQMDNLWLKKVKHCVVF